MRIHTTARNFELTAGLRRHIEERLSRFGRVQERMVEARVILSVQKHRHLAEIALHGPGGDVVGRGESSDMYASIDLAVDKVMRQLKRHKERASDRTRGRVARAAAERMARIDVFPGEERAGRRAPARVVPVETEHQAVERIALAEALERVKEGGSDCLVFREAGTGGLRVLYRRRDGRIALVEPETEERGAAAAPGARSR